MEIGQQVFYRMTDEESKGHNHQKIAPAMILGIFENEYSYDQPNSRVSEYDVCAGLNLKIFTDGAHDINKTSVQHGPEKGQWCHKVQLSKQELQY